MYLFTRSLRKFVLIIEKGYYTPASLKCIDLMKVIYNKRKEHIKLR